MLLFLQFHKPCGISCFKKVSKTTRSDKIGSPSDCLLLYGVMLGTVFEKSFFDDSLSISYLAFLFLL